MAKKLDSVSLDQVTKLAEHGHDDKFMSSFFGVSNATWCSYKNTNTKFFEKLKAAKSKFDFKIERNLANNALGYDYKSEKVTNAGTVVEYTVHKAPETTACIIWLKNRQPERWREKHDVAIKGDLGVSHSVAAIDLNERIKQIVGESLAAALS